MSCMQQLILSANACCPTATAVALHSALQCFDTWLRIRKSILPVKNFSDEVLSWLSVWSDV